MYRIYLLTLTALARSAAALGDEAPNPAAKAERIDAGFVFIDGVYLPPPYVVGGTDKSLTINETPVPGELSQLTGPGPGGPGRFGAPWRGGRGDFNPPGNRSGFGPFASPQRRIEHRLKNESVLVAFEGRPLVFINSGDAIEFLRVTAHPDHNSDSLRSLIETLPHDEDRQLWSTWLSSYRPPDNLVQRATAIVEAADAVRADNLAQVEAVQRIDKFSYPMSVLGMVLAVLATGHLLTSLPTRRQKRTLRSAAVSVALVISLSALDLGWTILAAQAGQMRELNPLGNGLISDPFRLVAFKTSATLISCGLLLALRRHYSARLAAWWLCLVLTILTFRWLAFNSMFMGS